MNNKLNIVLILFVVLNTYFINLSHCQESPTDTLQLDEIIITGTPVKINKNNMPMSVSVITKEQILQTDESSLLSAISGKVPGLFVSERGVTGYGVSGGSAGQISIRGIGANPTTGVLILIDGHPQFMGIMGHPLPDTYVASDAERIEIIRGPASILYGTNAMGGVMNIITRKQKLNGLHGDMRMLYGSYNTQKYMASGGYRKDRFSIFASFNHDRTDGHRDSSDFKILNGYIKMDYDLNPNLKFTTDFSLANFDASDPGPDTLNAIAGTTIDITRGYGSIGIENSFNKSSGSFKFFYNFGEHKISDGFRSTDVNYGFTIFETYKFTDQTLISLGADYINYGGKARNIKAMEGRGIVFTDTTVYEAGIFGYFQQQFFSKLTINGGLRLQHHQVFGNVVIPSMGVAYAFSNTTSLKASVSKGYRSPTIRELFIKQWGGNPDLKPENVINYEIGLLKSFYDRKLNVEITGFIIKGDNLIQTIPGRGMTNSGTIKNKGIEFAAKYNPIKQLYLDAVYSYINMNQPVYATPEQQLYIGIRYTFEKLTWMVNSQWIRNLDSDATAKTAFSNYELVNTKIVYRFIKFASLFFSIENLFNNQYEIIRYYTMPGVTVFGGINLNL